jgi:hypothetical protein
VLRPRVLFKLLKLGVAVACLGAFAWVAFTVPIGKRTLWEHGVAIGKSKESKELVQGTKDTVTDLTKRIIPASQAKEPKQAGKDAAKNLKGEKPRPSHEHLSSADRKEMRRLLDSARSKAESGPATVR